MIIIIIIIITINYVLSSDNNYVIMFFFISSFMCWLGYTVSDEYSVCYKAIEAVQELLFESTLPPAPPVVIKQMLEEAKKVC